MTAVEFVAHFASQPKIVQRVGVVTFDGDCWLYKAGLKHYPRLSGSRGQYTYVHRLSLAIKLGAALDDLAGMESAHKCDRPRCVNPEHLFLATHAENMADMGVKGRHRVPMLAGDDSPHTKMSQAEIVSVISAHSAGESIHSLARRLPVSRRTIQFWVRGTWRPDAYEAFYGQSPAGVKAVQS